MVSRPALISVGPAPKGVGASRLRVYRRWFRGTFFVHAFQAHAK